MSNAQFPHRQGFDREPSRRPDASDEPGGNPLAGVRSLTDHQVPRRCAAEAPPELAQEGLDRMLSALAECAVFVIAEEIAPLLGIMIDEVRATAKLETDCAATLDHTQAVRDVRLQVEISSVWGERAIDAISRAWSEQRPIILKVTQPTRLTVTFASLS